MEGLVRDRNGEKLAGVEVELRGDLYAGTVTEVRSLRKHLVLFHDFEAAVNNQLFVELDRLQGEIESLEVCSFPTGARRSQWPIYKCIRRP